LGRRVHPESRMAVQKERKGGPKKKEEERHQKKNARVEGREDENRLIVPKGATKKSNLQATEKRTGGGI